MENVKKARKWKMEKKRENGKCEKSEKMENVKKARKWKKKQ
jgi:hypothetical protein